MTIATTTTVAAQIDAEIRRMLDRIAADRGIGEAEYAAEAIRRVVESDDDFRAFRQVGIDAEDRGDVVPHEEVMAELDAMVAKHRARCLD